MILYFDGLCEPRNPGGVATYGYLILDGGIRIREESGLVGAGMLGDDVSNNVAEYTAMIKGLEYLASRGYRGEVAVRGDSQLTIRQMQGAYSVKAPRLIPLHQRAAELRRSFKEVTFEWVPREANAEADLLSRRAFEDFVSKHGDAFKKYYGTAGRRR